MRTVVVDTRAATGTINAGTRITVASPDHEDTLGQGQPGLGQSIIAVDGHALVLSSDMSGTSAPLWSVQPSRIIVTDRPEGFLEAGIELRPDAKGAAQFRAAGYTLGSRTLLEGINRVQAGHTLRIDLANAAVSDTGPSFQLPPSERFTTAEQADRAFTEALDVTIGRTLTRFRGRRLVVPLSGGLDSRLLAAWLKRLGYEDVLAFSYGRPGSRELDVSRKVAEELGIPWQGVELIPDRVTQAWRSSAAGSYISMAHGATSLPHVQDWFALHELLEHGVLSTDDVILPGHTVIGNLHDEEILHMAAPDREPLCESIVRAHLDIDGRWKKALRNPDLGGFVRSFLEHALTDDTPQAWADAQELFNATQRQSRYINNSVRAYEALGLSWDLPMLDVPMWQFAGRLPLGLSEGRAWYREFVNDFFSTVTQSPLPLHRDQKANATTTARVGKALARVHLKTAAERLIVTRYVLNHPLGLDLYVGDLSRMRLAARLLRGDTVVGIYAQQFLSGRWNSSADLHMSSAFSG